MLIRRSIFLAAVATVAAGPALAQDGPPPTAGDAVYGGSYGGAALGPAYGGTYSGGAVGASSDGSYGSGSYGGGYTEDGWEQGTSYSPGQEPQYDAPPPPAADYVNERDAGADYGDDRQDAPAYAPAAAAAYAPLPAPYAPPGRGGPVAYQGGYPAPMASYGAPTYPGPQRMGYSPEQRADWLHQCRARYGRDNDGGLGGAVIGGVVGGVIGNRVAGKHHRTVGTLVGAGVGAVAGAAIDKAEDRGRAKDECEDYLDRYEAYYGGGSAVGYGTGVNSGDYGARIDYAHNVIFVPMIVGWNCKPKDEEGPAQRVIEPEPVEYAPAHRVIYTKPAKVIRSKAIKQIKYSK